MTTQIKPCTLSDTARDMLKILAREFTSITEMIAYCRKIAAVAGPLAPYYTEVAEYYSRILAETAGQQEEPIPHPSQSLSCFV